MKLIILVVGKEKDFPAYELVTEYSSRIAHYMPIEWRYIPAGDPEQEEKAFLKALDREDQSHVAALDETGKELTSVKLAEFIQGRMNESAKSLVFMIGGSYGLSPAVKERAQVTISLSKLTFPHQLVRLVLAEQLYRACTILKGEKYHH